jgi:hypothetical protein
MSSCRVGGYLRWKRETYSSDGMSRGQLDKEREKSE